MKIKELSLQKLLSDNRFLIVVSVILAFTFWLVVTTNDNPVRSANIDGVKITIDIENSLAATNGIDVVSENYIDTATVTVQGPNYIVSSLKSGDISVTADLSDVTDAGTYDLRLIATRNSDTVGYNFISVVPSTIRVTFDYMNTKEFKVTARADGISATSGLIADIPAISTTGDSFVTVRGPKDIVDRIETAVAVVDETETISTTKTYDNTKILLYDKNNAVISDSNLTLSIEKVKVTVPICKKKEITVTPTFINEPYEGFGNSLISSLSASTVTVIGTPSTIDSLSTAQLSKIDFSSISPENYSFDMAFNLPDGVRVLDSIEYVTVAFNLNKYKTKNFTVLKDNITFKNVGENLTPVVSADIKNVKICGLTTDLNKLKNDDLYAVVDLSGKTAGEYTVNAVILSKSNNSLWAVGSYSITVRVQ